jgi:hypothetical protein
MRRLVRCPAVVKEAADPYADPMVRHAPRDGLNVVVEDGAVP